MYIYIYTLTHTSVRVWVSWGIAWMIMREWVCSVHSRVFWCIAVWCNVLRCAAVCCSVLQCTAVYCVDHLAFKSNDTLISTLIRWEPPRSLYPPFSFSFLTAFLEHKDSIVVDHALESLGALTDLFARAGVDPEPLNEFGLLNCLLRVLVVRQDGDNVRFYFSFMHTYLTYVPTIKHANTWNTQHTTIQLCVRACIHTCVHTNIHACVHTYISMRTYISRHE